MQGLVTFAGQIGLALAILLPTFCYLAAIATFLFAGWGFWRQAQPDNPFRGRPWVPVVSLLFSGAFASFDRILTLANISGGSTVTVGLSAGAFGYVPTVPAAGVLGASPGDTVLNVVEIFRYFFQAFGAMMAFFALYALWSVLRGISRRRPSTCLVQFVFGVALINVQSLSRWLAAVMGTSS